MAYATVEELTAYLGSTPATAQLLLDRASRQIDQALLCSVYDTTAPAVIAALKAATLEQVASGLGQGDTTGTGVREAGGFTIGKLSMQRPAAGSQTGAAAKVAGLWEQAYLILQQAGLTGPGPQEPSYGLG